MRTLKFIIPLIVLLNSCSSKYREEKVAVLTDKENLENFLKDPVAFWNPTKEDLKVIDSLAQEAFLRETKSFKDPVRFNYDKYYLQIVPYINDDKKVAYVNALCDGENLGNWRNFYFYVYDGGDCYWQVVVDIENESFSDFSMNGP